MNEPQNLQGELDEIIGPDLVERLAVAAQHHQVMITITIMPHTPTDDEMSEEAHSDAQDSD